MALPSIRALGLTASGEVSRYISAAAPGAGFPTRPMMKDISKSCCAPVMQARSSLHLRTGCGPIRRKRLPSSRAKRAGGRPADLHAGDRLQYHRSADCDCRACDTADCGRGDVVIEHHRDCQRAASWFAGPRRSKPQLRHSPVAPAASLFAEGGMNGLLLLIPLALLLGGMWLLTFLWTLKSGQYDDLDGAAYRILEEDDL